MVTLTGQCGFVIKAHKKLRAFIQLAFGIDMPLCFSINTFNNSQAHARALNILHIIHTVKQLKNTR